MKYFCPYSKYTKIADKNSILNTLYIYNYYIYFMGDKHFYEICDKINLVSGNKC